jgi:hypothetical protein
MTLEPPHGDVAAYALGVLNDWDTLSFERHLAECDHCAMELDSLLPVAGLLSQVDRESFLQAEEQTREGTLFVDMVSTVSRARRKARVRLALAIAAAVAMVAGLGLLTGSWLGSSGPTQARALPSASTSATRSSKGPGIGGPDLPPGDRYTAHDQKSGVAFEIFVDGHQWGTQFLLSLTDPSGPRECQLVAVSRSGAAEVVGTWRVPVGGYGTPAQPQPLLLMAATRLPRTDIQRLEVRAVASNGGTTTLVGLPV